MILAWASPFNNDFTLCLFKRIIEVEIKQTH